VRAYGQAYSGSPAMPVNTMLAFHQQPRSPRFEPTTTYSGGVSPRGLQSTFMPAPTTVQNCVASSTNAKVYKSLPVLLGTETPSAKESTGVSMSARGVNVDAPHRHDTLKPSATSKSPEIANSKQTPRQEKKGFAACVHKVTAEALKEFRRHRSDSKLKERPLS